MKRGGLNAQVLDADKTRVIRLQADLMRDGQFFLAGGTGLGLRLGHRLSNDLDWFTPQRFDAPALKRALAALPEVPSKLEQNGPHTIRAFYKTLETSFITYQQVTAKPETVRVGNAEFLLADLDLMAAMKAAAVHDRGAKRDFVDIHAICSQPGWSVGRFIEHAAKVLPLAPEQVARALTYFVDADREPMPAGVTAASDKIKGELNKRVLAWERDNSPGIER